MAKTPYPRYCRDCGDALSGRSCPCGSSRVLDHVEAGTLSIAHVDCDAFFCSVEKRDDPSLIDKPVIVGGGTRGVVAAACYNARLFGVRSAMPMFKALKLCPHAVVIRPTRGKYSVEGRRIRQMMSDLTPIIEPLSIDEAFLDLSGTERLHGRTPAQSLIGLQRRILDEVGVTVSVGLSYNKFLAKTASDLDKPNGFAVLGRADALDFLADKPVEFIYGIGPSFARNLNKAGLRTIADVRRWSDRNLAARFGEGGLRLARLARAEDHRPVKTQRERKSVSAETTFSQDISDLEPLLDKLWYVSQRASDSAKAKGVAGSVVTLKLKTARFKTLTRRRTLASPVQLADEIFRACETLLRAVPPGAAYRLIGAGISDLSPHTMDAPGDLLDPGAAKRAAAERASDAAKAKFGTDAVMTGRNLRLARDRARSRPAQHDR